MSGSGSSWCIWEKITETGHVFACVPQGDFLSSLAGPLVFQRENLVETREKEMLRGCRLPFCLGLWQCWTVTLAPNCPLRICLNLNFFLNFFFMTATFSSHVLPQTKIVCVSGLSSKGHFGMYFPWLSCNFWWPKKMAVIL